MEKVLPELKEYICVGVDLIVHLPTVPDREKKILLRRLLGLGAGASWQPIKITHAAVELFAKNDFKKPKGLERAHIYHRRDTLTKLIEKVSRGEEWWDWYKKQDYTVLATRAENRDESSFKALAKKDIPKEKGLFRGKRVGYVYGDAEKAFLRTAARDLGFV
jgi:hypothetical protein